MHWIDELVAVNMEMMETAEQVQSTRLHESNKRPANALSAVNLNGGK